SSAARPAPQRGDLHAGGRCHSARGQRPRAQRVQDRSGAPGHHPSAVAGGARHAAVPVKQEDRVRKPMAPYIGTATSRVDGFAKVTGAAKYAAELNVPGLAHASLVCSTIAKGRILSIDTSAATRVEGVLSVLMHENRPAMADNDEAYK